MSDEDEVSFKFVCSGEEEVADAFANTGNAADKASKKVEAAWERAIKKADALAKASQKAADAKAKAEERAADKSWKAVEQAAAKIERELEKEAKTAERLADRKAKAEERAAERTKQAWANSITGAATQLAGSFARSAIGAIGGMVREAMKMESVARRIAIDAHKAGSSFADHKTIKRELERAALDNPGVSAESVGQSVSEYGKRSGNYDNARKFAGVFATTQSAVGDSTSAEEIGKAGATLSKRFDITTVEDMGEAMAKLRYAAKDSGQPLSEMVGKLDKLASAAKQANLGSGMDGLTRMLSLNAIARAGGISERQAPAAVQTLLKSITSIGVDQKKFKALSTGGSQAAFNALPIEEKIATIFGHTKYRGKAGESDAAQGKITKVLGTRGMEAVKPLWDAYKQTYDRTGGTDKERNAAATAAMTEEFKRAGKSSGSFADIQAEAAEAQKDPAMQLAGAYEKLKAVAGDELAPALSKMVGELAGNTALFDGLRSAIELLGAAAVGLAEYLESKGLLGGSDADKVAAADKAIDSAAAQQEGLLKSAKVTSSSQLSPEDQAKYDALDDEIAKQGQKKEDTLRHMSALEGVQHAGSKDAAEGAYTKSGGSSVARFLAGKDNGMAGDIVAGLAGETGAQRSIRHAGDAWAPPGSETSKGAALGPPGSGTGAAAVGAAVLNDGMVQLVLTLMGGLGKSAAAAGAALDEISRKNRPSITGDHQ